MLDDNQVRYYKIIGFELNKTFDILSKGQTHRTCHESCLRNTTLPFYENYKVLICDANIRLFELP